MLANVALRDIFFVHGILPKYRGNQGFSIGFFTILRAKRGGIDQGKRRRVPQGGTMEDKTKPTAPQPFPDDDRSAVSDAQASEENKLAGDSVDKPAEPAAPKAAPVEAPAVPKAAPMSAPQSPTDRADRPAEPAAPKSAPDAAPAVPAEAPAQPAAPKTAPPLPSSLRLLPRRLCRRPRRRRSLRMRPWPVPPLLLHLRPPPRRRSPWEPPRSRAVPRPSPPPRLWAPIRRLLRRTPL